MHGIPVTVLKRSPEGQTAPTLSVGVPTPGCPDCTSGMDVGRGVIVMGSEVKPPPPTVALQVVVTQAWVKQLKIIQPVFPPKAEPVN